MKRMLEYLRVWWMMAVVNLTLEQIRYQQRAIVKRQERIMALMSDVVTLAGGVSAKLDQLLAQQPVATQAQVDSVAQTLTDMGGKLDAALPPPATPAA